MEIYVVQPGDTVDGIARQYGVSAENIIFNNQLEAPYPLAIGQALLIGEPREGTERVRNAGGYAYTYISRWVLRQTLPYLTRLFVFSYGFTQEGKVLYPPLEDQWMIDLCQLYQTIPVLTLTPFGEDGAFNNNLIHEIVTNNTAKNRLFHELLEVMRQKGYRSFDIDFEFILPEDRDLFTNFVGEMAELMHANGYTLSVALAPKTSDDQPGLLYEGKDYEALGRLADEVLIMTYEWGYKYGPPMAVAPLSSVRRVLDYGVSRIEAGKINLGIANYGYDWPLPYERGVTEARTIGHIEAIQIAIQYGATIEFDEKSASPFFEYVDEEGISHVVWFEDVRSLERKYALLPEYGLHGIGVWQIMRWYRGMWLLP